MARTATLDGIVREGELYTLAQVRRRLNAGERTFGYLVRSGLPVIRVGGKRYVSGRQLITFMEGLKDGIDCPSTRHRPAVTGAALDGSPAGAARGRLTKQPIPIDQAGVLVSFKQLVARTFARLPVQCYPTIVHPSKD